ncbi:MAG: histidinol-phosphate aminotransferase family protein [Acidobacteria bacterium]|nr:MAG: histidinol-phosphate aminotransferase family protein [Acidobacteriota bacterium]
MKDERASGERGEAAAAAQEGANATPSADPRRFVRPQLRALAAYHLDLSPCPHKLDQNEVPFDLPRRLKERIARRWLARDWARYPDFHSDELRRRLGRRHRWPWRGVLVGNGSNELLGVVLEAVVRSGQEVLIHLPSFGLYKAFVLRAGGVPRFVGPRPDVRLPLAELAAAVAEDPRRPLILCSPNNPTGDAAEPAAIERLLEALDAPLLLDNAYGEFCRYDYRPLLARHRHLILLRTFSKAWSLAGQRLGYLLADPGLVDELIKVKLPYNVGHASAIAGEEALAAGAAVDRRIRVILGRRPQWKRMLEGLGFEVFPSEANFLLVRHPQAARIQRALEARGVRARDVSGYPGLDLCLRLSVGSGRDLRATERALRAILEEIRA